MLTDSCFYIPTMKPKGVQKSEKTEEAPADLECACFTCPSQEACKAAQEAAQAAPIEEKIDFSNVEIEPLFQDFVDFETFSKSDFRAVKVLNCEAVPKSKKLLDHPLRHPRLLRARAAYRQDLRGHHQPAAPAHDGT